MKKTELQHTAFDFTKFQLVAMLPQSLLLRKDDREIYVKRNHLNSLLQEPEQIWALVEREFCGKPTTWIATLETK